MAALLAEILDVGAQGLGDTEAVQDQQAGESVVTRTAALRLDQEAAEPGPSRPSVGLSAIGLGRRTRRSGENETSPSSAA